MSVCVFLCEYGWAFIGTITSYGLCARHGMSSIFGHTPFMVYLLMGADDAPGTIIIITIILRIS